MDVSQGLRVFVQEQQERSSLSQRCHLLPCISRNGTALAIKPLFNLHALEDLGKPLVTPVRGVWLHLKLVRILRRLEESQYVAAGATPGEPILGQPNFGDEAVQGTCMLSLQTA
jgi:hypothetical protein